MRIMIIHNIMWSHYKAFVFSKLHEIADDDQSKLEVIQIARSRINRKGLGEPDLKIHQYNYDLLFHSYYEEISALNLTKALFSKLRTKEFDVINLPGYNALYCWALLPWLKLKGKKVITTVDSNIYDRTRTPLKEFIKRFYLKFTDLVFCYGTLQVEYLESLGVPKHKIHIRRQATGNSKLKELYKPGIKENSILYVGRLSKEKNLERLIMAVGKMDIGNWKLDIVGTGVEEDHLKKVVRENKFSNIVFHGGKSYTDVIEYYSRSKIFVLPSTSEPWGLVVHEAMLCDNAILVSQRCGCSKDLVENGENGFTFDPYSIDDLRQKLNLLLKEDLKAFGKHSGKLIEKYTPENSAQQMYDGFKKLSS